MARRAVSHQAVMRRRGEAEEGNQSVDCPSREAIGSQRQARGEGAGWCLGLLLPADDAW